MNHQISNCCRLPVSLTKLSRSCPLMKKKFPGNCSCINFIKQGTFIHNHVYNYTMYFHVILPLNQITSVSIKQTALLESYPRKIKLQIFIFLKYYPAFLRSRSYIFPLISNTSTLHTAVNSVKLPTQSCCS